MTIYDIDARIQEILMRTDEETGELPEDAITELMTLAETRDVKVDNAACMYLDLLADAKKIKDQEAALAQRRKSLENRAERIKNYIKYATNGEAFSSSRVQIKYSKSQSAEITDSNVFFMLADEKFIRRKDPEPDKVAIRKALKDGEKVPGAELVEHQFITIK